MDRPGEEQPEKQGANERAKAKAVKGCFRRCFRGRTTDVRPEQFFIPRSCNRV